ncbi:hypothetical protein [Trinickia dinghuensis]|uniref:hypothetical protein n=1 Tax=Trinickia dinghuensis TaxID=2291023 RepID=UPI0015F1411C|nr:hypothetical protein [Trinickia dinghuensis]
MPYRFMITLASTLPLSIALCAGFAMLLPGGWRHSAIGAMVLAIPMWIGIASWLMAVSSRRRFVAVLLGAYTAASALFFAARFIGMAS